MHLERGRGLASIDLFIPSVMVLFGLILRTRGRCVGEVLYRVDIARGMIITASGIGRLSSLTGLTARGLTFLTLQSFTMHLMSLDVKVPSYALNLFIMKHQFHRSLHSQTTAPTSIIRSSAFTVVPQQNDNYIVDTMALSPEEQSQQIKQDTIDIASLNTWKNHTKRMSFSQQSFNRLINQGRIVQEERNEYQRFPSPHINSKLIQSICDNEELVEGGDEPYQSENKKFTNIEARPKETQEVLRKNTNQKLVNKILFNKLSKNLCNQLQAKHATAEVLNSFKSLTAMFKSVQQLINYEEIYNQIIQAQKMPNRILIITKEFDKDLERQQQNFNDIVKNKLDIIKDQDKEVKLKKKLLSELRTENCSIRDQIQAIFQRMDEIKKQYLKDMATCLADTNQKLDKKKYIYQIRLNQENQTQIEMRNQSHFQQELENNKREIAREERIFDQIREQKNNSRQELSDFLRTVLKNEEIQIQDSLVSVVKLMILIKQNVSIGDFPHFLDQQSRNYIMTRSQLEVEIEDVKKEVRRLTSHLNITQTDPIKNYGNRPFYEQKLKQIQMIFSQMKNEHRQVQVKLSHKAQSPTNDHMVLVQDVKFKQHDIEAQIDKLEATEIMRLKSIHSQKQLGMTQIQRLVKSVQAEFGAKRMNNILMEVFNDQKSNQQVKLAKYCQDHPTTVIQLNAEKQQRESQSQDKIERTLLPTHKTKSLSRRLSLKSSLKQINFNYDPIYNNIPQLQNVYYESTFFPTN